MPRYFFHIRSAGTLIRDPDGTELPDIDAARHEAELAARDLLAGLLKQGEELDGQTFEITDGNGHVLDELPLRSVLRLPSQGTEDA